ncbi:hypothetical protein LMG28688_06907 [Paraburkholderia caffeinitolerans]|uniref:Uncharacterized protein n=1 Tax=Paraburkholderia caffeinitolerans TaxID=1723730 RepID=A0A6J5GXT5_9BURK|nr:hypothetical protein [Paraburkholderia caffeinitolerans]CAB3809003.1 hypothetical protein LMG28688_06907 [Paraburkholderia caffeinitolerans]
MAIHTRSSEAEAARRFLEATRNVDQAFRAVRAVHDEADDLAPALACGEAQSRLDLALDELARAQALFDSVARVQGRRRAQGGMHA